MRRVRGGKERWRGGGGERGKHERGKRDKEREGHEETSRAVARNFTELDHHKPHILVCIRMRIHSSRHRPPTHLPTHSLANILDTQRHLCQQDTLINDNFSYVSS